MKVFNLAKNAIESLYFGLCDIFEYKDTKITSITKKQEIKAFEGIPCRLSYSADSKTADGTAADTTTQSIKLFLSPDIDIKAGSKIIVTQNGKTVAYKNSGEPAVYQTHQEIALELFKGWA